jgi:hypothetical protein
MSGWNKAQTNSLPTAAPIRYRNMHRRLINSVPNQLQLEITMVSSPTPSIFIVRVTRALELGEKGPDVGLWAGSQYDELST